MDITIQVSIFPLLLSTRLVFLVSGGPGRPPLSGRSVAFGLRNKLRKQKNDFLIYKARRVDTVSEYSTNIVCKSRTTKEKGKNEWSGTEVHVNGWISLQTV